MPKETHTKVRSMRSDATVWDPFGAHVGKLSRSAWLNMFMGWINDAPEEWLTAVERHGDDLGPVLAQFLAWYEREPNAKLPRRPAAPTDDAETA